MLRLTKVSITNYRSINNLVLEMPQLDGKNALFLFGINESGKSNLLKALSLLDRNSSAMKNFNYDRDCRKAAKRKNPL